MTEDPELAIRARCDANEWERAATLTIEQYGPELLSFLIAMARDQTDGLDAYSQLIEMLWRGLPRFRWQSSLRTWCYATARHAMDHVRRAPHRRAGRQIALSEAPEVARAAEAVRTKTVEYLQTAAKDRVNELRSKLTDEEQMLLVLRVDRGLAWRDVVRVMADEDDLEDVEIVRRAATFRKRFEGIKRRLREAIE